MESSTSRILIETVVRKTLKDIKKSPERSTRNLVDMALHFSGGRFQQNFFRIAQTMLQNESSPYYALLRNVAAFADTERLVCFGMNLGYNSCTMGAKKIRENEQKLKFNIPWSAAFQIDGSQISGHLQKYHTSMYEALYTQLKEAGFLYSAYYAYSEKDMDTIACGDLFYSIQQVHPIFTILLAQPDCPDQIKRSVHQIVTQARNDQLYETFPLEFYFDSQLIDKIISDDDCFAGFNQYGALCDWTGKNARPDCNLFENGLTATFRYAYPKNKEAAK